MVDHVRGYKIDVALVIDATGSMIPFMDAVKKSALAMNDLIVKSMEEAGRTIDQLRMRVIDFSDYAFEGKEAIHQTEFFTMPEQKEEFDNAIKAIEYEHRGGDVPENALEALYFAMNSDWVKLTPRVDKGRHIIILVSDAYPLNLMERNGCEGYPADVVPPDTEALREIWDSAGKPDSTTKLSGKDKRLIMFTPENDDGLGHRWDDILEWDNVLHTSVESAAGLVDITFDLIVKEIVRSTY